MQLNIVGSVYVADPVQLIVHYKCQWPTIIEWRCCVVEVGCKSWKRIEAFYWWWKNKEGRRREKKGGGGRGFCERKKKRHRGDTMSCPDENIMLNRVMSCCTSLLVLLLDACWYIDNNQYQSMCVCLFSAFFLVVVLNHQGPRRYVTMIKSLKAEKEYDEGNG